MVSFNTANDIGMEKIAREVALVLINEINDELEVVDAGWQTLDQELAAAQGIEYYECISDPVESKYIHVGHRPSFIENSAEEYPNIAVMSYQAAASGYSNFDQGEDMNVTFYIEFMVKDGPYEPQQDFIQQGEILVNKKGQRMGEAIHRVVSKNSTLNGLISGFDGAPLIRYTDCMRRLDATSTGDQEYYWQMGRIEYQVTREIVTYY